MRITGIVPVDRSRSQIFLDEEFAFVLYKGELRSFKIREGEELSGQAYEAILTEVLPKRAKLRAMNLLQKKFYTVAELRRKLLEGRYPEDIVEQALDYVASYGYTDDVRFAEDYIRFHSSSKSRRRIQQDLSMKGVSAEDIEKAYGNCMELGLYDDEQELDQIRRLAEKKHFDMDTAEYLEKQKFYAFLMRKGYSLEQIDRALRG